MRDKKLHENLHTVSINGQKCEFRAYLTTDGERRCIWRISTKQGNDAQLDASESKIILPNSRRIRFDGRRTSIVQLPRWLGDALYNDFEELDGD